MPHAVTEAVAMLPAEPPLNADRVRELLRHDAERALRDMARAMVARGGAL